MPPSDAVCLSRPANRQLLDTGWYDRFFDPLSEVLARSARTTLLLERPDGNATYRFPRHGSSMLVRGRVRAHEWAANLDLLSRQPAPLCGYEAFRRDVRDAFPAVSAPSFTKLVREVRFVRRLTRYFAGILREADAKIVLCTYYYNPVAMALCQAAHERGIPSVDVQHGVVRRNPAYECWTAFPEGGYSLMPTRFWCWSEYDTQPVRDWPVAARDAHRSFVGGHPWMAFWQSSSVLAERHREQARALRGGGLNILVSLSWTLKLSPLIEALLRASPRDWTWWIRLHPLMEGDLHAIESWCRTECSARTIVDFATDLPLPVLLDQADVHLTHNSSVIQEATAMGLPTVAIDARALDMYASVFESGWARHAAEPAAIFAALLEQAAARTTLPDTQPYPSWEAMAATLEALLE